MKISVYAIAKNEEKFASRWAESMSEADEIVVLDTGSTDNTVKILSSFSKVRVYSETVSPWRFDTARNKSLAYVSKDSDYCVCTDLDEVFDTGWREKLEKALLSSPDKVSYRYVWSFSSEGLEETVFNIEKIHRRHGFIWTHPVHEILTSEEMRPLNTVFCEGIRLCHHPDSEKSRLQYLPLLELSVKEDPTDDRNMHYLGREYMFRSRYNEAIDTLKRHLSLQSAVWKDERSASMQYIAKSYEALGNKKEAFLWYIKACTEAEYLREPWIRAAEFFFREKNWHGVIFFTERALEITTFRDTYISDLSCRKEKPYDLLSIAYFYTGDREKSIENAERALSLSPDNERIKGNLKLFRST